MSSTKDSNKNISTYNTTFAEALAQLNPAQKTAVEQIEGPVMVIAGPGTGKTHILAARIGRILSETDTLANSILCLTFTDAGVHAMRERLLEFIGPEAHRVHIYTFHSFCNSVIQENLELFGRHDLEPLSELERVELIRELIDGLPTAHPLKSRRSDRYFYERHLHDLFQRMKAEDWSVQFVQKRIQGYLQSLSERPDFRYQRNTKTHQKGDLKAWKVEEATLKMERLQAATDLFPEYEKLMRKNRRYDFADMILWVLRAFEQNEALLRNYQERYLYFLVDEYQDTNGSQNHILQQLITYWEQPNIFIVGDDDQSIFEFQGARLRNLTDFYSTHEEELTLVMLDHNYRSNQPILDAAKLLIDQNQKRITRLLPGLDKQLQARHPDFASSIVLPKILSFENRIQEEVELVRQIEQLQADGQALNEVAVIYARHRQARNLISLLDKKGIPYNTRRQVNILDIPLIQHLRQLLRYLQLENHRPYSGEHLLFQILHFEFLGIDIDDLAILSFHIGEQPLPDRPSWRDIISRPALRRALTLNQPKPLEQFARHLRQFIADTSNLALVHLIEKVINRSGLLHFVLEQADKAWLLQVLHTFLAFAKKEADKQPRLSLGRLLQILDNMDANRLRISLQKTTTARDGVNLLTAHSSKGLEFRYVFIIDAVKDQWESSGRRLTGSRFTFPDTLTFSGEEDAQEARRRLFYVAMTRARTHLQISYAQMDERNKLLEHSTFVDELLRHPKLSVEAATAPAEALADAQYLQLLELQKPVLPAQEWDRIEALLEGFVLSISSLNRFLRCPLSFYYENVLKIPSVQSEAASYGIAMHHAMRRVFEKMKLNRPRRFPGIREFIGFFEDEMHRLRSYFGDSEFERRLESGRLHLRRYYQLYRKTWPRSVQTEFSVRHVELEGVPLTGTIDFLDLSDEQVIHIIDYKTGSTSNRKLSRPTPANPLGGNYWRQLVFYKILYELMQPVGKRVASAAISYLEPDAKGDYPMRAITFQPGEVQQVRQIIVDSYKKIRRHEFYEGCGESSCQWCQFVRQRSTLNSLVDREAEAFDD